MEYSEDIGQKILDKLDQIGEILDELVEKK